jgi:hypothetical protein
MGMKWRRSLERETTPVGPCPDEAVLRCLAERFPHIALSDQRVYHVASCLRCTQRVITLRQESRGRRRTLAITGALSLLIMAAAMIVARGGFHKHASANDTAVVADTVNLWDARAARGARDGTLQSVSLPATMVRVTVILPRFSPRGLYLVAVARNQKGEDAIAEDESASETNEKQEHVSVDLDLRNAKAGEYFLSATHIPDQASYNCPLRIK